MLSEVRKSTKSTMMRQRADAHSFASFKSATLHWKGCNYLSSYHVTHSIEFFFHVIPQLSLFQAKKKKISAYLVAPHLKTILYSSVFLLFLIFTVSSPGVIHYSSIEHRLMYKYKCVFWFASHLFYYIRHLSSWAPPRIRVILQRKSLLNGPLFPRVKSRLLYS